MIARALLALLVALPISVVGVGTAAHRINQLLDPCVEWGVGEAGGGYLGPHDPCGQRTGFGETRTQAYLTIAAVQGVMLLAAVLGVWGAARSRPKMMLLAGILTIFEMFPTAFSVWPLALLTGAGFIYMGLEDQRQTNLIRPTELPGWNDLGNIVVDDECDHHHQKHKADLEHCFLHLHAEISPQQHLDQQGQNNAAVQNRNRE